MKIYPCTLYLVRGIPGSGKSTWAKKNFQCCILENDQMQIQNEKYVWSPGRTKNAINLVMRIAKMILSNHSDVCVCNTFTKKKYVEAYKKIAEEFGADFKVYRCTGKFVNVHNVPEDTLKNMKDNFEDWPNEEIINPEVSICL